jgi:hypothetical protein
MSDEDEPQVKLPVKEGRVRAVVSPPEEWSSGLRHLDGQKANPVVKKFQEDYKDAAANCYICGEPTDYIVPPGGPQPSHPKCRISDDHIEPHKGNRAQRALLLTSKQLEDVAHQISALATEYGDPDTATVRRIEDAVAARIAKSLREKPGKFQMAREAVAEWIEEGKWRGE